MDPLDSGGGAHSEIRVYGKHWTKPVNWEGAGRMMRWFGKV